MKIGFIKESYDRTWTVKLKRNFKSKYMHKHLEKNEIIQSRVVRSQRPTYQLFHEREDQEYCHVWMIMSIENPCFCPVKVHVLKLFCDAKSNVFEGKFYQWDWKVYLYMNL